MIDELIDKYKTKLEYVTCLKNKTSFELVRVSCSEEEFIVKEIINDLEKLKEPTICGYTVEETITIIQGLEIEESPYCEICGHCGDIGCCGISNFIDKHIKGKTNCKNEKIIINELEDLCDYQTETFKENKHLQSQLDISNKKLEEINSVVRKIEDSPYLYWDNVQRILLSIIGDESNE